MHPIIDLHCDLLSYLAGSEDAKPTDADQIGCALPWLQEGGVKLQVLAVYTTTGPESVELAARQCRRFSDLVSSSPSRFTGVSSRSGLVETLESDRIGFSLAIENASGLCTEDDLLARAFERVADFGHMVGRVLYITLTHHGENRFGGGNQTGVGLKDDGRALLDFLHGKRIAVDLSHTSDPLAFDILHHLDINRLEVPVLASHSNFRAIHNHPRNLPDELAAEISRRGGVIGLNFVRAFVDPDDPLALQRHILHAFEIGLGNALCFGADFFHWMGHPDRDRAPFFHPGQEHAGRFQTILEGLATELGPSEQVAVAYLNAARFLESVWA